MVVKVIPVIIVQLHDGKKRHLYERNKLTKNQPDVHHADIGGWRQLFHHANKLKFINKLFKMIDLPNEQGSYD